MFGRKEPVVWVTDYLAAGPAPASSTALDWLRKQGITGILNLCGEFPDLKGIEEKYGFEVYYLPVPDEEAPALKELEKALAWLDEALYLGKKVYVHCRHGVGRTGTILNSYLLRRGLGHKLAGKRLKGLHDGPANFTQWRAVRKYGKETGQLTCREPSLEFNRAVDLTPFIGDYLELVATIEDVVDEAGIDRCGKDHDSCSHIPINLCFVEAVTLSRARNTALSSEKRIELIDRAVEVSRKERSAKRRQRGAEVCMADVGAKCPLWDTTCLLYEHRPVLCRMFGLEGEASERLWEKIQPRLDELSADIWFALTGEFLEEKPEFPLSEVISGKYVERFFTLMMGQTGCV